jgi:hypothetical protein
MTLFENQWLKSEDFQALGFFDSLNKGMQATGNSVRSSLAPPARRA